MPLGRAILAASAAVDRACRVLAAAALGGMVLAVGFQVVARYGFRAPPVWTEELARYLMVWGGLLGATVAYRAKADPRLVPPDAARGRRLRAAAAAMLAATTLVFLLPVGWYSFLGPGADPGRSFLARNLARTSEALEINMTLVAAAVPACVLIVLLHALADLVALARTTRAREPAVLASPASEGT